MPAPIKAAPEPAPPRKTNWVPSRKALSGGLAGIGSFFIIALASWLGYPIPDQLVGYIPAGITWLVYYVVPASEQDIVRNLDNKIVALAVADRSSPVSQAGVAAEVNINRAAVDAGMAPR